MRSFEHIKIKKIKFAPKKKDYWFKRLPNRISIIERFRFNNDPIQYLIVKIEKIPYVCKIYKGKELIPCGCVQDKKNGLRLPYISDCLDCNNSGWRNFGWDNGVPHLYWQDVTTETRYKEKYVFSWTKNIENSTFIDLNNEHSSIWGDLLNDARDKGVWAWNYNILNEQLKYE